MEAGAAVNESLTNRKYDGEYEISAKESKNNYIKGIQAGKIKVLKEGKVGAVMRGSKKFIYF